MTKICLPSLEDAHIGFMLLSVLPDTHAWLKDVNGVFVYADPLFYRRFGFTQVEDLIGKNDYDLSPPHMAAEYVKDDQLVLTGQVVTDRLELINRYDEAASWFLTCKWPVYNPNNEIIGTFGSSRHLNKTDSVSSPFRDLNVPIEYIRRHFAGSITVEQVAASSHLSVSALERRFKKHLSKTPRQYITEMRLDHARHMLLETHKSLAVIAQETGFSDQSHFTRAYKKRFGLCPSHDRNRNRVIPNQGVVVPADNDTEISTGSLSTHP